MVFDWDEGNTGHLAEHDVKPHEAEEVLLGETVDLDVQLRGAEERYIQVGRTTKGRHLVVVTTIRGERIRVVTAYPAKARLRRLYREARGEAR